MPARNPFEALLTISDEINSVHETPVLLNRVMDIAMQVLKAERGFILLKTALEGNEFDAVTARNISQESISSIRGLSSSVVNQVLANGEPVVAVDAQEDQRFSGAESVVLQNIRSVMCTPLISKDGLFGAIYMDNRADAGQFTDESLQFLQAFAAQAVIALENAKLFEQLKFENELLRKQISLGDFFPEIIGKSQPIMTILEMINDVAESTASVLIEGESGTGKELVARALHVHST